MNAITRSVSCGAKRRTVPFSASTRPGAYGIISRHGFFCFCWLRACFHQSASSRLVSLSSKNRAAPADSATATGWQGPALGNQSGADILETEGTGVSHWLASVAVNVSLRACLGPRTEHLPRSEGCWVGATGEAKCEVITNPWRKITFT